jgi:hypothetical protein
VGEDMSDRLFVPLASDPFRWFASGDKTWELRAMRGQYNAKNVRVGRRVELRRGYSTPDSLWGTIEAVVGAGSIADFFDMVPWREVICAPTVADQREGEKHAAAILGVSYTDCPVIGFRVALDATCPKCNGGGE